MLIRSPIVRPGVRLALAKTKLFLKKLGKLIKNIKMRNLGQIRVAASAETDQ